MTSQEKKTGAICPCKKIIIYMKTENPTEQQ